MSRPKHFKMSTTYISQRLTHQPPALAADKVTCRKCGSPFAPFREWHTVCFVCDKEFKAVQTAPPAFQGSAGDAGSFRQVGTFQQKPVGAVF